MINKSLKSFFNEVAEMIEQAEHVRSHEMGTLIEKWKRLLENLRKPGSSPAEEYRKWYHLKLSVEWIKETFILEKKSPNQMCLCF